MPRRDHQTSLRQTPLAETRNPVDHSVGPPSSPKPLRTGSPGMSAESLKSSSALDSFSRDNQGWRPVPLPLVTRRRLMSPRGRCSPRSPHGTAALHCLEVASKSSAGHSSGHQDSRTSAQYAANCAPSSVAPCLCTPLASARWQTSWLSVSPRGDPACLWLRCGCLISLPPAPFCSRSFVAGTNVIVSGTFFIHMPPQLASRPPPYPRPLPT